MRFIPALFAFLIPVSALAAGVPAVKEAPVEKTAVEKPGVQKPGIQKSAAEKLLDRLAHAQDRREARNIERQIEDLWSHSGSATADLLLQRSEKALDDDDDDTAQAILEKLTNIAPTFAEGWHQRAEVASRKEDFQDAMASLHQVLALQPKHFGALAELGEILENFGDKPHALAAYRDAIKLDPFIDGVDDRIRELSRDVEGQGI